MSREIEIITSRLEKLETELLEREERVNTISSDLVKKNFIAVQQWQNQTNSKMDDLENLIKSQNTTITTLAAEIAQLRQQNSLLMAKQFSSGSTA